jgi:uncharacterized protein YmfQ (DUF2313 family)
MARSTPDQYGEQLSQLLPPGVALPSSSSSTLRQLLEAFGLLLADAHNRGEDLLDEADPRTTVELLEDWERNVGLPDPCIGEGGTLQERRLQVLNRLTRSRFQTVAFFKQVALELGYVIEIEEFRPPACGRMRCGDRLNGAPLEHRFYWRVAVPDPRLTLFRTGQSRCGDRLTEIDEADDLECVLRRMKPAHTTLLFSYEGP